MTKKKKSFCSSLGNFFLKKKKSNLPLLSMTSGSEVSVLIKRAWRTASAAQWLKSGLKKAPAPEGLNLDP